MLANNQVQRTRKASVVVTNPTHFAVAIYYDEKDNLLPRVIAKGAEPNTGLYDELAAAGFEAHMVGDCQGVGHIIGAVRNAADVAAKI